MKTRSSQSSFEETSRKKKKPETIRSLSETVRSDSAGGRPFVFRKAACACGGDCPTCESNNTNLPISHPADASEIEADAAADKVMRMQIPESASLSPIKNSVQKKESQSDPISFAPPIVRDVLSSGGAPLDARTRAFMEPRFDYDFGGVKIYDDGKAAKSAASINALAYTFGDRIVFNSGQYDPSSDAGKRLLAHELAHVVQQNSNGVQPKKIQRAVVTVNNQTIQIEFGNVASITNLISGVQALITTFTGTAPAPADVARITALAPDKQRWLLFALDILVDNTTATHAALIRTDAVDRLIAFAPSATTGPGGNIASTQRFAREVLIQSGWTDVALTTTTTLTAPGTAEQAIIDPLVNPPATGGLPPGRLDAAALRTRLSAAVRTRLRAIDPALRGTVARQSMTDLQSIGDIILAEARVFFSPYSDAARTNVFNLNPTWVASANISDTTTQTPNRADRINYLTNRATSLGRNSDVTPTTPDVNIFADTNFDRTRTADQTVFANIVSTLERDPVIRPLVNRLIRHTGFQDGSGMTTRIGIDPEFDSAAASECEARWSKIDTLCHEVLHALAHPNFDAAAGRINFDQVVIEGFTEVLGTQLFNDHVIPKAGRDRVFKASMEVGLSSACTGPITPGTIGYRDAGRNAETIRQTVHDDNFRAAYFLGRPDLVGM